MLYGSSASVLSREARLRLRGLRRDRCTRAPGDSCSRRKAWAAGDVSATDDSELLDVPGRARDRGQGRWAKRLASVSKLRFQRQSPACILPIHADPALTAEGLLPPGVHIADLREIEQAFGRTPKRRFHLFQKLAQFEVFVRSFKLFQTIYIDGSFVTDKDDPGDIDAVLELPRADLAKLLAHRDAPALVDGAAVKAKYEVHLFIQPPAPVPADFDMARFFQHLRPEEAIVRQLPADTMRGILKVEL